MLKGSIPMGLDIQLVVEAASTDDFREPRSIALFHLPRQTNLFFALAGMRGKKCLIPARGFPVPSSSLAQTNYGRWVVGDLETASAVGMACISKSEALDSLAKGASFPVADADYLVSAPEFSTPSWLRPAEFFSALKFAEIDFNLVSLECKIVLHVMEAIEAQGYQARMVFWFSE